MSLSPEWILWMLRKCALCSEKAGDNVWLILYKESEISKFISITQSCIGEIIDYSYTVVLVLVVNWLDLISKAK